MAQKKALVIGGLGVIGRNLINHMAPSGEWEIVAVSRRDPDKEMKNKATFISCDLLDVSLTDEKLSHLKKPITLTIIGCVVDGPGEAAQPEIGLTGGGQDNNLLYLSGIPHAKVASSEIINKVVQLVEEKVKEKNS